LGGRVGLIRRLTYRGDIAAEPATEAWRISTLRISKKLKKIKNDNVQAPLYHLNRKTVYRTTSCSETLCVDQFSWFVCLVITDWCRTISEQYFAVTIVSIPHWSGLAARL